MGNTGSRPRRKPLVVPPEMWLGDDVTGILADRDVAGIFRHLRRELGASQRQIATLTGQSQSEVSEILAGRQVVSYDVLTRIADGLGIPRWRMNLAAAPTEDERRRAARHRALPLRPVVPVWDGALIARLRVAMRLSMRAFARTLGVSDRATLVWESAGVAMRPRTAAQAALDELLRQAPDDAVARFAQWPESGWVLHVQVADSADLETAAEAAMKIVLAGGLPTVGATVSPARADHHRYTLFCARPVADGGVCIQRHGHGGDCHA